MAAVPEGCKLVLDPQDDFNHEPDEADHYNESLYFSVFDREQQLGGWYRLGNRVREGHAELSNCWYLPDGRVTFMDSRPPIASNEEMDAGGLCFEVLEPMERHRIAYEGKACVLNDPRDMADPGKAFHENPMVPCRFEGLYRAATPVSGGEVVYEEGSPLPLDPEKGFGKAHFDQFNGGDGWLEVGDDGYQQSLHFTKSVGGQELDVRGEVVPLIPLRNRRERPDGTWLQTRITEGMTAFTCNGEPALGMTEYLDQIVDGRPIGRDAGA